jgi:hypothetical protein
MAVPRIHSRVPDFIAFDAYITKTDLIPHVAEAQQFRMELNVL